MKRTTLKKFILLSLSGIIVFLLSILIQKISHESEVESLRHNLEDFPLIESDGNQTSSTALCNGTTVLILFNSTCEHCQAEIKDISEHHVLFKETAVALISTEPLEVINAFASDFKLDNLGHFKCYHVSSDDLYKHFGTVAYPEIYIYKNLQLTSHHKGETKAEVILENL
jgi:thiol-disulfide isomerase/thioredoxin